MDERNVYGEWSRDLSAAVTSPVRTIHVAGMAAKDPADGHSHHAGDCAPRTRMTYDKLEAILAVQAALAGRRQQPRLARHARGGGGHRRCRALKAGGPLASSTREQVLSQLAPCCDRLVVAEFDVRTRRDPFAPERFPALHRPGRARAA